MNATTADHSLRPPFRGDKLALGGLVSAVLIYIILLLALKHASLLGGEDDAALLSLLRYFGYFLTIVVFAWCYLKDWRWLHAEETDIDYLLNNEEGQQDPARVLHPGYNVEATRRVETLLDDRIVRVLIRPATATGESQPVRESELRAVAMWRSASIGSLARYGSGLLLLLTVLGTFIGVKTALVPLVKVLENPNSIGGSELASALDKVAGAFGANLSALVGAIVLGLAGYALGAGRQNMLARLEQAASLYVYPKVKRAAPTDMFTRAMERLDLAAGNIGIVATQITELGDTITDLSSTVSDSLEQTRSTLKTLLEQQATQVAEQSRKAVDKLEHQISDTVASVSHATTLYGTLVGQFEADHATATAASKELTTAVGELREVRQTFAHYADTATHALTERLSVLEQSTTRQADISNRISQHFESMNERVGALGPHLARIVDSMSEGEAGRVATQEIVQTKALDSVTTALRPTIERLAGEVEKLRGSLQSAKPGGQTQGIAKSDAGSGPSAAEVTAVLSKLARTMERIDNRASESVWQTVMRKVGARGG